MLQGGKLGVHPPGALGVAFFIHANADCLVGRGGDGITHLLKKTGSLNLLDGGRVRNIALNGRIFANLLEAEALDRMPELLLVCCNPDQLGLTTAELTRFLENLAERNHLESVEDVRRRVPILLILPNGILAEQTLETYQEQINESRLMGRLPRVSDAMVQALVDRCVRGVSLQAGGRKGSGKDSQYILERKGSLVFAGGGDFERMRMETILSHYHYPFTHAQGVPGTRVEFDKAMISIVLNVGGLIHMVRPGGELIDLRMGDLCKDPTKASFVHRITRAVFDVGQSCRAYPREASYDAVWEKHRATILAHADHVTSSVKSFRDALAAGLASVTLFSNEEWILTPLGRYAAKAGLNEEESLFRSLKHEVQAAMARAIQHRDRNGDSTGCGATTMNLAAQRNIGIELFESGRDNVVLVGTLLDNEHLIKLEMTLYLPDEQITRSRLNMIRVPFPVCREVESVAERLVGLRIERGVLNEITRRVGGKVGCSHIKELATNIVYFVAAYLVRRRAGVEPLGLEFIHKSPEERFVLTKELLRDSCLAYCQTTPQGLDEHIGIRRINEEHRSPIALGEYESTIGRLLADRTTRWADRVYLRWREGDAPHQLTRREFYDRVQTIARHLLDLGLRPGERVMLLSENRADMWITELAVMAMGCVALPVFAGDLPRQIGYVLAHARPKFVIVSGKHQLQKIDRESHPWVKKFFCMDFDDDGRQWGAIDFAELTRADGAPQADVDERMRDVQPDDVCLIMYTSGTTGPPKGVRLCHRNILSQQRAIQLLWDVSEKDVVMNYLPWHHSFGGIFEVFLTLYHGCELGLDDSRGRDLDRMLENWREFDPTIFFSVPRVHDLLVSRCREDAQAERVLFGGRLRFVFTAGASLPAPVEAAYRLHGIPVLEGWGLTETSPSVTLTNRDHGWKSGYVGFPIPGVAVRLDADQEILVKGPNVMLGYLDDEEATAHVLDAEGWFRTGDLGEFTKEGLRILGRKDGAFKLTTGEKVHPQRIEMVLVNESGFIHQAVAVGSGQNFVAVLIYPEMNGLRTWAGENGIPEEDLLRHPAVVNLFADEIARVNRLVEIKFQRVRRAMLIDREPSLSNGELTATGKLVRRAVLDHHKDKVAGLFSSRPDDAVIDLERAELQRV